MHKTIHGTWHLPVWASHMRATAGTNWRAWGALPAPSCPLTAPHGRLHCALSPTASTRNGAGGGGSWGPFRGQELVARLLAVRNKGSTRFAPPRLGKEERRAFRPRKRDDHAPLLCEAGGRETRKAHWVEGMRTSASFPPLLHMAGPPHLAIMAHVNRNQNRPSS